MLQEPIVSTAFLDGNFNRPEPNIWQTRYVTEDVENIVPTDNDRSYAPRPSLLNMNDTMPALFEELELCALNYDEGAERRGHRVVQTDNGSKAREIKTTGTRGIPSGACFGNRRRVITLDRHGRRGIK